ncbi:Crp/Fnr family transcriptional regulator [Jiulongibacter sediminis]|uniref:Crp/Fnr family transcriptional regulator n=1 Tax=Jiulongibacter sediminis TaxID=1605367 RepID=UPI0026F32572|nr:hypothetical protein [Jiulongibacter sediminis]
MLSFKKKLKDKFEISDKEISEVLSHFKRYEITKGTFLINELQHEADLFYVSEGLLREFYFFEEDGSHIENTTELLVKGDFYLEIDSFNPRGENKSAIHLQALTKSIVFKLDHTILKENLKSYHLNSFMWNTFFREILIERLSQLTRRRYILNSSRKSLKRYYNFKEVFEKVSPELNDKLIASYLGISQSTLSIKDKRKKL